MAGVEIAILGLGLKAVYEITILSHTLTSVPSSLRRSVQLVKVCYRDLEGLIELRNQSIPILKTDPAWLRRVDSVIEDAQDGLVEVCKMVERAWEGVIDALHRRVLGEMTALRAAGLFGRLGLGELGGIMNSNMETQDRLEGGTVTVREWDDVGLLEEMFGAKIHQRGDGYILPALPTRPPSYDFTDFRRGVSLRESTDTPITEATRTAFTSEISTGLAMIPDGPETTDITPDLVTSQDRSLAQTSAFLRHVGGMSEASDSVPSLNSGNPSCTGELRNRKHMSEVSLLTATSGDMEAVPQPPGIHSTTSEVSLPISGFVSEVSHGIPRTRQVSIEDASPELSRNTSSPGLTSISDFDGMDLLFGKLNFYTPTEAVELPTQPYHPKGPAELQAHHHDVPRRANRPKAQTGNDIDLMGTERAVDNARPTPMRQTDDLSRSIDRVSWSVPNASLATVAGVYELPDGEAFRVTARINNTETK
ncbi:hypothetical protein DL546_003417 [Coniochaeta pulveracea]|uniref:Fungal N-terminal domain-containing protein n=1 Tax=Coniochaeta pulveracea TaxID=177199 RepID=A0A420YAT8_9PEZI|nr:hypothetical protein DL546_003417 [Coniochaeta pulveracea]